MHEDRSRTKNNDVSHHLYSKLHLRTNSMCGSNGHYQTASRSSRTKTMTKIAVYYVLNGGLQLVPERTSSTRTTTDKESFLSTRTAQGQRTMALAIICTSRHVQQATVMSSKQRCLRWQHSFLKCYSILKDKDND